MIITTTPSVEGRKITTYQGVVFGESITGINLVKDIAAGFRNILGGRSKGYEEELCKARQEALEEMEQRAQAIHADAVVAIRMDYEVLGSNNGMLMVTCSGTAVQFEEV